MALRLPVRWQARLLALGTLLAVLSLMAGLPTARPDDASWLAVAATVLIAGGISRIWPRCPRCRALVIRDLTDWISPDTDCPQCLQPYSGPRLSDAAVARRSVQYLVKRGVLPAGELERFDATEREKDNEEAELARLRAASQTNQAAARRLAALLTTRLADHQAYLSDLRAGRLVDTDSKEYHQFLEDAVKRHAEVQSELLRIEAHLRPLRGA